ncbi:hypothetical protein ACLWBD_00485 [Bdellovibrio sp. HCB117]|uniref:hypothetical protein n=1 Tax=Bdellovibrio sp. HCB117 TaxID=3394359 RepID=UPI0039B36A59
MKKVVSKDVIRKIKDKEQAQKKSNYTFRLSDSMMQELKAKCEKSGVSMASVVEELVQSFVDGI